MSKTSKTAFYYPSKSARSTGESPSEKVNTAIKNSEKKNNAIINLTEGKISSLGKMTFLEQFRNREKNLTSYYNMSNKSNGRTLNVPKVSTWWF